jgi:voltage-gated potassium channel
MEVDLTKSWPWRVAMIEFFITTLRLARSVGSAYRRDPQFRSLVFLVLVTLLGGTVFYSTMEGWSVVDALYFSVTTLTTVGLGDLAPKTTIGKIFMMIYIFAGLRIIVGFIETVAKETLDRQIGRGGGEEGQEEEGVSGT